jgi:formate dehydrogenase major subunit
MKVSRRFFLGTVGAAPFLGLVPAKAEDEKESAPRKIQHAKETTTICPYCGVGCGQIVHTRDGAIVNIEGDPDHPINEGALCSKGASIYQLNHNDRRLTKVLHRKPGADSWEEMSWDDAMRRIIELTKRTRDETWVAKDGAATVNRTDGIACLGGAALDTEECYLLSKAMRAMGVAWLEHQARI